MPHTIQELHQMQELPLAAKVRMTQMRIQQWVLTYGQDGVYISFSGGKDSTVLLHMARQLYPGLQAVYVDTGLEYPEIREFVKTFPNVEWLRPTMNFREVIETYGFPLISKDVSEVVAGARHYVRSTAPQASDKPNYRYHYEKIMGEGEYRKPTRRMKRLMGVLPGNVEGKRSAFNCEKYKFFLDAPFEISARCCYVMKKSPAHRYQHQTGRHPMTAQMATESRLRTQQWLKNGCNGFEMKEPISNPMSFWTEQDVLEYIVANDLPICSVYGKIVATNIDDLLEAEQDELTENDVRRGVVLKTTGCQRTGCMFCGYGCHLEKPEDARFARMRETHPKQYDYMLNKLTNSGVTYKEAIDWTNEHGNLHILY